MNEIKIFLASAGSLKDEREKIAAAIALKNDVLVKEESIYLKLEIWEKKSSSFSRDRKQNDFNTDVVNSDIFICLIYDKVGPFTKEEFEKAHESFNKTGKPKIIIYFCDIPFKPSFLTSDFISVIELKNLIREKEQISKNYENIPALLNMIDYELELHIRVFKKNNSLSNNLDSDSFINKVKKKFDIKDEELASLIYQVGTVDKTFRTLKTLESRTGFEKSKIDSYINNNPDIFIRKRNKNGDPLYRLTELKKVLFDKYFSVVGLPNKIYDISNNKANEVQIESDFLKQKEGTLSIWAYNDLKAPIIYNSSGNAWQYIISHSEDDGAKREIKTKDNKNDRIYPNAWSICKASENKGKNVYWRFSCNNINESRTVIKSNANKILDEGWHLFTVQWSEQKTSLSFILTLKLSIQKNFKIGQYPSQRMCS
jgi:hypothetical protein